MVAETVITLLTIHVCKTINSAFKSTKQQGALAFPLKPAAILHMSRLSVTRRILCTRAPICQTRTRKSYSSPVGVLVDI